MIEILQLVVYVVTVLVLILHARIFYRQYQEYKKSNFLALVSFIHLFIETYLRWYTVDKRYISKNLKDFLEKLYKDICEFEESKKFPNIIQFMEEKLKEMDSDIECKKKINKIKTKTSKTFTILF